MKAGEANGLRACGLAARDTLRTEMGYPLHGQDLSLDITPVQARLRLGGRLGQAGVLGPRRAARREGGRPAPDAVGAGGARPRHPAPPHGGAAGDDVEVGEVTSGTFSPTKRVGIALALLDTAAGLEPGDEVEVDIRGRRSAMRVVKPPFVQPSVR